MQEMRTILLTSISFGLTAMVIGNAYYQKKQFYPSVVYITKSNPSMAVRTFFFETENLCWQPLPVSTYSRFWTHFSAWDK